MFRIIDVACREKPGRKQWMAVVKLDSQFVEWRTRSFYGRTRDAAVAKAQRWVDRKNREIWVSEQVEADD